MSKNYYHDASVSNTAAWQEIVKLRVLLSVQLLAIVGSDSGLKIVNFCANFRRLQLDLPQSSEQNSFCCFQIGPVEAKLQRLRGEKIFGHF